MEVPVRKQLDDLTFAVAVALQAGRTMRAGLGSAAVLKGDGTPVTRIDRAINADVAAAVAERSERMLGEEDTTHPGQSAGKVWVCDPIDGTWLFAASMPGAVFSLALVEDGTSTLGVIYDPWTDRLITAVTGTGAFLNGRPISVNTTVTIAGACLSLPGGKVEQVHADQLFADAVAAGADVVTSGSAIADALMVPLGFAAGAVYPYTSPWDMAAIAVVVTEAGGRITDLHGRAQRYDTQISGAVVSNGLIHDELLSMVTRPKATEGGDA
jgi:myo-inositol-1(or 4)-monophosphatase